MAGKTAAGKGQGKVIGKVPAKAGKAERQLSLMDLPPQAAPLRGTREAAKGAARARARVPAAPPEPELPAVAAPAPAPAEQAGVERAPKRRATAEQMAT